VLQQRNSGAASEIAGRFPVFLCLFFEQFFLCATSKSRLFRK
jgi:hypothetical protein